MNERLKSAIIALLERRADQMLTSREWQELAEAFHEETGMRVEWRTHDELRQ
jgi:hypothetical protein